MSINFNKDTGPEFRSATNGLGTRAEQLAMLPRVLEKVATPTIELLSGLNGDFLKHSADFPVIERSLKLLLICHPYEPRQDAAAAMLQQESTALAQPVIEAAIPFGMQGEALRTSSTLLIERLGRQKAADILVQSRDLNEHITDLLIKTVRGWSEVKPQENRFEAGLKRTLLNPSSLYKLLGNQEADHSDQLEGLSLASLTTNFSANFSSSLSKFSGFSPPKVSVEKPLNPLDQLALAAFVQLVPFASQTLPPEKFHRSYLDTAWKAFDDDLAMRVFSATFAAFQTNNQTRDLVFDQLRDLDSALAESLRPLVLQGLKESPVHRNVKDYYDWYNDQLTRQPTNEAL